jgi:hypothetical protein
VKNCNKIECQRACRQRTRRQQICIQNYNGFLVKHADNAPLNAPTRIHGAVGEGYAAADAEAWVTSGNDDNNDNINDNDNDNDNNSNSNNNNNNTISS